MNLLLQWKKLGWFALIGLSLGVGCLHLEAQDATEDKKPEAEIAKEFLEHARLIRDERAVAAREGRRPELMKLLNAWGGATIAYRRRLIL